jgi:hypothetical protein
MKNLEEARRIRRNMNRQISRLKKQNKKTESRAAELERKLTDLGYRVEGKRLVPINPQPIQPEEAFVAGAVAADVAEAVVDGAVAAIDLAEVAGAVVEIGGTILGAIGDILGAIGDASS